MGYADCNTGIGDAVFNAHVGYADCNTGIGDAHGNAHVGDAFYVYSPSPFVLLHPPVSYALPLFSFLDLFLHNFHSDPLFTVLLHHPRPPFFTQHSSHTPPPLVPIRTLRIIPDHYAVIHYNTLFIIFPLEDFFSLSLSRPFSLFPL